MPRHTTTVDGWKFERVSAAYIDITPPGTATAVEAINCWNYAAGRPDVPDTYAALETAALEWLETITEHDERTYIEAARGHDAIEAARNN